MSPNSCTVPLPYTETQAALAPLSQLCPQTWPNAEASKAQRQAGWQGKDNAAISMAMRCGEPGTHLPATHGRKALTGVLSLGTTVPAAGAAKGFSSGSLR